jgi:hypothetical protein
VAAIVHGEDWDIRSRLSELDLTREQLIDIVKACVAAQGGCTDNDPPNSRGYESWRWGVRRSREILRPEGWEKDDTGGFATIVNHKRKIRLAVMNSDDGAGTIDRIAQNRSRKGPNSERAATANQQLLIPGSENWPIIAHADNGQNFEGYTTWHLCIYISGDIVRAELSILNDFESGYFKDCFEKILILGSGDWDGLDFKGDSGDDSGPELDIEVLRK